MFGVVIIANLAKKVRNSVFYFKQQNMALPWQSNPSPLNPPGHKHVNEPIVLEHVASRMQLCSARPLPSLSKHSSTSIR